MTRITVADIPAQACKIMGLYQRADGSQRFRFVVSSDWAFFSFALMNSRFLLKSLF